jgi:hypothetical protein
MRLIDADELLKHFRYGGRDTEYDKAWISTVRRIIKEQPTAYDVDAVCEEIINKYNNFCGMCIDYSEGLKDAYGNAVEIVKRGGVDER